MLDGFVYDMTCDIVLDQVDEKSGVLAASNTVPNEQFPDVVKRRDTFGVPVSRLRLHRGEDGYR